ncbi:MAG: hypothetical protein A2293_02480 [Elusimicrobia bacterium RIFOXYB2_FULL_49_7]|nr:MAG: hypothetical protein A2293_02480 [Elusimicrobia bacterium RIFOXYB2_FULL_49_7]
MNDSLLRINRYLALCGLGSRRECESIVLEGRVAVNGTQVETLSFKVDREKDSVSVNGTKVKPSEEHLYIMLNKPPGYVVSRDGEGLKSVYELLTGQPKNLAYAGRLDTASEGLLLFSTNGEFINRLTHPRYGFSKIYLVTVDSPLSEAARQTFRRGIRLEEGMTLPAQIEAIAPGGTQYRIILHEGKNRQIRRMMEALGVKVLRIRRVAYGNLTLGNLKSGLFRHLTENELRKLKRDLKLPLI